VDALLIIVLINPVQKAKSWARKNAIVCFIMTFLILVPKFYLGIPTVKLCLTNDSKQSLSSRRSQAVAWEREIVARMKRSGIRELWHFSRISFHSIRATCYELLHPAIYELLAFVFFQSFLQ